MASEEWKMVVVKPISHISHSRLRPSEAQGRRWQHSAGHSISWGLKPRLHAGVKMKCAMDLAVPSGGVLQGSVWAQSCLMYLLMVWTWGFCALSKFVDNTK